MKKVFAVIAICATVDLVLLMWVAAAEALINATY